MIKETRKVTGMHCPKCTVELAYDGQPSTLAAVKAAIAAEDFVVED